MVLVGGLSDESMKFTAIMPQKAEVGQASHWIKLTLVMMATSTGSFHTMSVVTTVGPYNAVAVTLFDANIMPGSLCGSIDERQARNSDFRSEKGILHP